MPLGVQGRVPAASQRHHALPHPTDFSAYLKRLEQRKPVVVTGDLNVAPADIDIHSPKTNLKSAGGWAVWGDFVTFFVEGLEQRQERPWCPA